MRNVDMKMHIRGRSVFVDDIPAQEGLLHAVLFLSPIAKGTIEKLDISKANKAEGVAGVFVGKDIPGPNQIGHMIPDQPLFAEKEIQYAGQPIAMVVAESKHLAKKALKLIELQVKEEEGVFEPREAFKSGMIHAAPRVITAGDLDSAWSKCEYIVEGKAHNGPQEHFYFETQRALAVPGEDDTMKVYASVQSPGAFQHHIAEILNIPMHKVELEIRRLGGAFGGKESTAIWAVAPALAAKLLNRPVKMVLGRNEDIATSGKRHPYEFDYKMGLDKDGKILAYQVDLYQQAGAFADISLAVLGRSFLHVSSSYFIPNLKAMAVSCKTNLPSNNAFRGFGVPQGVFVIETAIEHASEVMGVDPSVIKRKNLLQDGDFLPYGMQLEKTNAIRCWEELDRRSGGIARRIKTIEAYNKANTETKKGISVVPVCFGISFAQTALNQGSALANIYADGSVSVSTGAVEMGQGVNMKIALIAAKALSIGKDKVRVETTNTSRIPNASPTSASTGADLNGMAAKMACDTLYKRLQVFAAKKFNHNNPDEISIRDEIVYLKSAKTDYKWEQLIHEAYWDRTDLGCRAFYATPGVYIDRKTERGRPFAYYSYGTSITEVTLDCIRGTYDIDSVDVVHDVGVSLSHNIDKGQIEGAIIQAIGWSTMEQIKYNSKGKMLTAVNSYKIPDIKFCPKEFNVYILENSLNPYAVSNSKAVGEPPFIHGLGAYFALVRALRSFRKDKPLPASLPITPEKAFMYLYE
ncbi:MAG TPA: xanthine dehydrogenase [Lentisphaeria bacterium]|nr:MAG: hypothetical protein A2X47_09700 [Lentisphaerae bacterium GWF2_38_69]HBM16608.1 xanthine dehydrogenase [Lentisphaeria bacterium]